MGASQAIPLRSGMPVVRPAATSDQVAEHLREQIIGGSVLRGQAMRQRDVARMLGVPLPPVRAALRLLRDQGYVTPMAGRAAVVAPLQMWAKDLMNRRLSLELRLTRAAAARMTPLGLRMLERLQRDLVVASLDDDRVARQRTNYRFHALLYSLAGRLPLQHEVQTLWASFPFDLMTAIPQRSHAVIAEHAAVLEALRCGDGEAAVASMRHHILQGWQAFRRHYTCLPSAERR